MKPTMSENITTNKVMFLSYLPQCGHCGSVIRIDHSSFEKAIADGYVESTCDRCNLTMKLPIQSIDCEVIPDSPLNQTGNI